MLKNEFGKFLDENFTHDESFGNYHVHKDDSDIMLHLNSHFSEDCILWCLGNEYIIDNLDDLKIKINIAMRLNKINDILKK